MELYIEVDENGNCVNHPILGDNLRDALNIEPKDGHPKYEPFIRIQQNVFPQTFEISTGVTYQKIDGVWKDVWGVRPMTDEERAIKQAQLDEESRLLQERIAGQNSI